MRGDFHPQCRADTCGRSKKDGGRGEQSACSTAERTAWPAAKGKSRPRSRPGGVLRLHRMVLPQYLLCAQAVAESSPQEVRFPDTRCHALSQPPLSLRHRAK